MIEIQNVTKTFETEKYPVNALTNITARIEEGHVFGLVGTNGAGKSTLMRCICGVYKPDEGRILVDGEESYDNPDVLGKVFYISDDQFFFQNGTPLEMLSYYRTMYQNFDVERFYHLMDILKLDPKRRINTFSRGMKKQLSVVFGICSGVKYLLCDETFDGLDPVMRQAIKRLFIKEMDERKLTLIIASHNLRELEDICEHVGLLHKGGILFSRDLDDLKLGIFRLQVAFAHPEDVNKITEAFPVVSMEQRGSLYTLTLRGEQEKIAAAIEAENPQFFEILPLTLEEIFICETEVLGYDFKDLTV